MASLAFVLALCGSFPPLRGQEPPAMATELEGIWQEPAPPGEGPGCRYRVTFTGDEVQIVIGEQITKGRFTLDPDPRLGTITITVTSPEKASQTVLGIYRVAKDRLDLQIRPEIIARTSVVGDRVTIHSRMRGELDLAPLTLTLTLAKVKK